VVQEVIAKRIIKAAMKGKRDPTRLRKAGLAALGYDREVIRRAAVALAADRTDDWRIRQRAVNHRNVRRSSSVVRK